MTNTEKAESCGEYVRDGLDALHDCPCEPPLYGWVLSRDMVVDGARQAGHWGRLALELRALEPLDPRD